MKKLSFLKIFLCTMLVSLFGETQYCFAKESAPIEYLILANNFVKQDTSWAKVVTTLQKKHNGAPVEYFASHPKELLSKVQEQKPRYVAIVDKPENLNRDYVIEVNMFSREVDKDIYSDFLWGIITGYDAQNALKMVNNGWNPLVLNSCVSTVMETEDGRWFDSYAYMDDQNMGIYGYKMPWENEMTRYRVSKYVPATRGTKQVPDLLPIFYDMYKTIDPDVIITASHGSQSALEMPFSAGFIRCNEGNLYAQLPHGNKNLVESGKRRVYLPIGNCLIGDIKNSKNSFSVAWMKSANVASLVGYVVTTWHGRSGWGMLKYLLTTPGRYTISESFFLNQQDMLKQMNDWYPSLQKTPFFLGKKGTKESRAELEDVLGRKPSNDELGFWHDRDVLANYGDPKWDVRLKEIEKENDFKVTTKIDGKKCILEIETGLNYDPKMIEGNKFKQVHVLDLPFSYFFPTRLNNPRLAKDQKWEVALDENFILVYNNNFKPNNKYTIVLDID